MQQHSLSAKQMLQHAVEPCLRRAFRLARPTWRAGFKCTAYLAWIRRKANIDKLSQATPSVFPNSLARATMLPHITTNTATESRLPTSMRHSSGLNFSLKQLAQLRLVQPFFSQVKMYANSLLAAQLSCCHRSRRQADCSAFPCNPMDGCDSDLNYIIHIEPGNIYSTTTELLRHYSLT